MKKQREGRPGVVRSIVEPLAYGIGIPMYKAGIALAGAFGNHKARMLSKGQCDVWRRLESAVAGGGRWIWVHCASLGEFEQGRPLIERIKSELPEYKVLLTFFSPSGYEVRKNYQQADAVTYLPLDTPGASERFLDIVQPEMAVFVKYELWRNYLLHLHRRGIPAYLISAHFRPDQAFFRKSSSWYAGWLRWLSRIYVQNDESRRLLAGIGIENVKVAGDTRFDRVAGICEQAKRIDVLERFAGRKGEPSHKVPVFIAGSSWPADEEVYAPWVNSRQDVKLIVAPHEFDARRLEDLKRLFGGGCVLKSEAEADAGLLDSAKVLIIDCFGLLSSAYAYADVAYVGGGFGTGIHNLNEAAAFSIPVIYGPNHHKFVEAEELKTLGGGIAVESREGFARTADRLFFDKVEREKRGRWAGEYIKEKTGATDIIFADLFGPEK